MEHNMRMVKAPVLETVNDVQALVGVIMTEGHLYQIGPISYPHFLKTRDELEHAVELMNNVFPSQRRLEAVCMVFPFCHLLIVRDTSQNAFYWNRLEEVTE